MWKNNMLLLVLLICWYFSFLGMYCGSLLGFIISFFEGLFGDVMINFDCLLDG